MFWLTLMGIYSPSWWEKNDGRIVKQLSTLGSVREQRQMHVAFSSLVFCIRAWS